MAEKNIWKILYCFRLLLEIWNVLHGKKKKINHFMHGLASWQKLNYFLDSSCITLSFVTSSLIERGKKIYIWMLAGKHIFAVFLDRNMTLAMREKKILCQHLELYKRWMKFIFLSNRLVFAVDTYSCQYDPCSWSKSWKSYGNVDNEREKTGR